MIPGHALSSFMCVFTHAVNEGHALHSTPPHMSKACWHAGKWVCKSRGGQTAAAVLIKTRSSSNVTLCRRSSSDLRKQPSHFYFFLHFNSFHLNFVSPREPTHDLSGKFGLPSNRILRVVACCHIDRPCDKDIRCDFPLLVC